MTLDELGRILGPDRALQLIRALENQNRTLTLVKPTWVARGYTGATLVAVIVTALDGNHPPAMRLVKVADRTRAERARTWPPAMGSPSLAALRGAPAAFREHLVEQSLDPLPVGAEMVASFHDPAGRLAKPLTLVDLGADELGNVCGRLRSALLDEWNENSFEVRNETVAEILERELRSFPGLMSAVDLGTWGETEVTYLAGKVHGDLHVGNVILHRSDDENPSDASTQFYLVDLDSYDPQGLLSKDIATLVLSLTVAALEEGRVEGLLPVHLTQLVLRTGSLDANPFSSSLKEAVKALRPPGVAFALPAWEDVWETQLLLSLLEQSLRHTTYESSLSSTVLMWCSELSREIAGQLDNRLSGRKQRRVPMTFTYLGQRIGGGAVRGQIQRLAIDKFVDREDERGNLARLLEHRGAAVITLNGLPGIGKTAVVGQVLFERRIDRLFMGTASSLSRIDVTALLEALEQDPTAPPLQAWQSPVVRIAVALDALVDQVVIVLDGAHWLLEARTDASAALHAALDLVATHQSANVKVLLVGASPPQMRPGVEWPGLAENITLQPFSADLFSEFVATMKQPGRRGLADESTNTLNFLWSVLRGNLRHAELLDALLVFQDEVTVEVIASALQGLSDVEIRQELVSLLFEALSKGRRAVLVGLAAFGCPVTMELLTALLVRQGFDGQAVARSVERLVSAHVVSALDGQLYELPESDVDVVLRQLQQMSWISEVEYPFLVQAADLLEEWARPVNECENVADLRPHLARVDIFLRAGWIDTAHELIEELDAPLRRLGREGMLLESREALRGGLERPFDRVQNENALGDLYLARRSFADAESAYARAVTDSSGVHETFRAKVLANRAQLRFQSGAIAEAHEGYVQALALMRELQEGQPRSIRAEIEILLGLGRCDRRCGRHALALAHAETAYELAGGLPENLIRVSTVASRWRAEMGRHGGAWELLRRSEAAVRSLGNGLTDQVLRAMWLDARGDLTLDVKDVSSADPAIALAGEALQIAVSCAHAQLCVQAHTTMAMASLMSRDLPSARKHSDAAARFRVSRRSLLALALQGVIARLQTAGNKSYVRFNELLTEATQRSEQNGLDFAAYHFEALARVGLIEGASTAEAVRAVKTAKRISPEVPGLTTRLAFLIELISGQQPNDGVAEVLQEWNQTS